MTKPISEAAPLDEQPRASSKSALKTIALPSVVDFEACRQLHQTLAKAEAHPVCVDTRAVRHLGGLGIQVLLAARTRWARVGLPFEIANPSDGFIEGLNRLGLSLNSLEKEAKG